MKKLYVIMIIVLTAGLFTGCSKLGVLKGSQKEEQQLPEPPVSIEAPVSENEIAAEETVSGNETEEVPHTYGNSDGNMLNDGYLLADERYAWFQNFYEGYAQRYDFETEEVITLCEQYTQFINMADGYLYLVTDNVDEAQSPGITRMRPDGAEAEKLYDGLISSMAVMDDTIYFIDGVNQYLHAMPAEGGEPELLCDDICYYVAIYGDTIVYQNEADGESLYRIGIDGTGREKLTDTRSWYPNFVDGYIYYLAFEGEEDERDDPEKYNVRRMDAAGENNEIILAGTNAMHLNCDGESIYFADWADEGRLYRMDMDGGNVVEVPVDEALNKDSRELFGKRYNGIDSYNFTPINVSGGWLSLGFDCTLADGSEDHLLLLYQPEQELVMPFPEGTLE